MDVNAIDAWGVPDDLRTAVEEAAIENVKRVARAPAGSAERFDWLDDRARAATGVDRRLPGDQDGLAPDRALSRSDVAPRHRRASA